MNNLILVVAAISIVFVIAAVLLGKLKKRWPKYIPAVLAASVTITFFIKAYLFSEGFEGLGYFILMLIALIVFIVALITAVIIEILGLKKRRSSRESGDSAV